MQKFCIFFCNHTLQTSIMNTFRGLTPKCYTFLETIMTPNLEPKFFAIFLATPQHKHLQVMPRACLGPISRSLSKKFSSLGLGKCLGPISQSRSRKMSKVWSWKMSHGCSLSQSLLFPIYPLFLCSPSSSLFFPIPFSFWLHRSP